MLNVMGKRSVILVYDVCVCVYVCVGSDGSNGSNGSDRFPCREYVYICFVRVGTGVTYASHFQLLSARNNELKTISCLKMAQFGIVCSLVGRVLVYFWNSL